MKKKVVIIGHFGGNENFLDGQTIKTQILYDELKKNTDWDIKKIDTYYKNKKPIKLLIQSMYYVGRFKNVIILLSGNGMKFFFPLLYILSKLVRVNVFHDVIGGNLSDYVDKFPKYKKYLNSFKVNWVETEGLKKKLVAHGIINCEVMPNFKRLPIIKFEHCIYNEPYRFCMFSRVMKEKGIEVAINTIQSINADAGKTVCELDIYGKIDDNYKKEFETIMHNVSSAIKYKGQVQYNQSVQTIKDYYALLFPTYWDGEGFPGTIIDAFSAGLPVIATDWNCNSEIIKNKKNGILYPNSEINTLKEGIEWMIKHKTKIGEIKKMCLKDAQLYQPNKYIKQIITKVEKK